MVHCEKCAALLEDRRVDPHSSMTMKTLGLGWLKKLSGNPDNARFDCQICGAKWLNTISTGWVFESEPNFYEP